MRFAVRLCRGDSRARRALAALVLIVIASACRAVGDARMPTRRTMPLTLPLAFEIEVDLYDLPLARAEELVHAADPQSTSLGSRIDEHELRDRLLALSRIDTSIVHAPRPSFALEPDVARRVAPRAQDTQHLARTLASDQVEITVKTSLSWEWQAYDLHLDLRWFQEGGAAPVMVASTSPMPNKLWLEIDALPAGSKDALNVRAWIGFVRAIAIWPPTGDL